MRSHCLLAVAVVFFALALFAPHTLLAQYNISTVAGGGPKNLAALSASIGIRAMSRWMRRAMLTFRIPTPVVS